MYMVTYTIPIATSEVNHFGNIYLHTVLATTSYLVICNILVCISVFLVPGGVYYRKATYGGLIIGSFSLLDRKLFRYNSWFVRISLRGRPHEKNKKHTISTKHLNASIKQPLQKPQRLILADELC